MRLPVCLACLLGVASLAPHLNAQVLYGTLGTAGLRALRGPGAVNMDLSLFRKFQLIERFNLEFRSEAYNFTNTPHFDNPNGSLGSSNYTFITSALQDQRVVRFALRLGF